MSDCQKAPDQTDFETLLTRIALRITAPIRKAYDSGQIGYTTLQPEVLEIAKRELAAVHFNCSDLDKAPE